MREIHFNSTIVFITFAVIAYLILGHQTSFDSVVGLLGGVIFNVSLLLIVGFGLQKFQLGTNRDIQKDIFDKGNVAAAIYQLGIWLALALVISKGLF